MNFQQSSKDLSMQLINKFKNNISLIQNRIIENLEKIEWLQGNEFKIRLKNQNLGRYLNNLTMLQRKEIIDQEENIIKEMDDQIFLLHQNIGNY